MAALAVVVLLALVLRLWNLSDLPAGFHGDEAVIGLEAQRILDEGYIGPYSPYAAGQPTGPIYLIAPAVAVFDRTVLAARIVPALLGSLSVVALYLVVRRSFGVPAGLISASILATMSWHLHFSRIGFPLVTWPLLAVLIAGTLVEATRSGDWRWWAAAGVLTGGGIYVYNAHPLLALAIGLYLLGYLVFNRARPLIEDLAGVTMFAVAALIVLIPMIEFATRDDSYYWHHFERDRLTDTEEWNALDGPSEQVRYIATGYKDIWNWLCCEPELDLVDGSGLTIITPPVMLLLALFGVTIALAVYRRPLTLVGLLVVALAPLGPVLSVGGQVRRTFVMAPFLAMFCALAVVGTVTLARRVDARLSIAAAFASLLILAAVVVENLELYFRDFADPDVQARVLGKPVADAAKFLDGLDGVHYAYFYSNTWSVDYATMIYLAPDVYGEDRSDRFGEYTFELSEHPGQPLFVFLGDYINDIEIVREMYPGEEITPDSFAERPTFRVFRPELP